MLKKSLDLTGYRRDSLRNATNLVALKMPAGCQRSVNTISYTIKLFTPQFRRISMKRTCLLLISLVLFLSLTEWSHGADANGSLYADWQQFRDRLAQDKSLVRYYTFEEPGDEVRNLAGEHAGSLLISVREPYYNPSLSYFSNRNNDFAQWTAGRFPEKPALSFGSAPNSVLRSLFYRTASGVLTLETWIRTHSNLGDKTAACLFSVGQGFGDGWFMTATSDVTGLRIGRPAGDGGDVDLSVKPLTGHVWHHLVAVIDRRALRLYVDGELAGTKEFSSDFHQTPGPTGHYAANPEEHDGGLKIGSIRQPDNTLRFDCDEMAIYDRVLAVDEIRAHYESGRPKESAVEQEQAHRALLERQTMLAGITMEFPLKYNGYFPAGEALPLTIIVPADVKLPAPLTVDVTIRDADQKSIFTGKKNLALSGKEDARLVWELPFPETCGLYQIDVVLKDSTGAVVLKKSYPAAAVVRVVPIGERPASSPLAGNVEPALGGRCVRLIPWCPNLPNGGPGFEFSDRDVKFALNWGPDVLFCISPRFDMGQVDLKKVLTDPKEWENWVRPLVERYKDRVKYWEILNEPNANSFGNRISPELYVALLKSAHRVIREVDPKAKIVGLCGVTTYPEWTENVLAAGGGGYFDILSFHNYIGSSPVSAWKRDHKIERTRAAMIRHPGKTGDEIPIWNTESGIEQPHRVNGRSLTDAELLKKYPLRSRQENGHTLVSANAITLATEHVGACWQTQSILLDCALGAKRWFVLMGASEFHPRGSGSDGCPSEKGIAYAALASVLTPMKSAQLIPISSSTTVGVLVTALDGRKTAALFADVPATRCFAVKKNGVYLGMDFLGNPLTWEAKDNLLTVSFGMEPIYIFNVPEDLREAPFLTIKNFPNLISPGSRVEGLLSVTNLFTMPMTGQLEITSENSTVSLEKDITLSPGLQKDVPFHMEAGALPRGNQTLIVRLVQQGREITSMEYPFASEGVAQGVPMATQTINLDGDPSEWQGIPEETADTATHVVIGRPPVGYYDANAWQGSKDLSFAAKTAWRPNDGIYFFITVTDDNIKTVSPDKVEQAFHQDALELFFDGRPLKEQTPVYSFGAEQVIVVPSVEDTAKACLFKSFARYGDSIEIEIVGKRISTGYVMEGRIRPREKAPFKLVAGARFGMDFVFDDAGEAAMTRKTQMALHGTSENHNDTSNFGRYYLMGGAGAAVSNLLRNPDLAQGEGETVPEWKFSRELKNATDADAAKIRGGIKEIDGRRALSISVSCEAQAQVGWAQTFPAKDKTGYAVSFRLKGKVDGKTQWCNGAGSVVFWGAPGAWLGWQPIGNMDAAPTGDWGSYSGKFFTPAGTQTVSFGFSVMSNGVKGTADFYCTDMVVSEQPKEH
ncbi:MAG: LamG-like jellyroll fold domain-containing protein [Victivallales bacterium]